MRQAVREKHCPKFELFYVDNFREKLPKNYRVYMKTVIQHISASASRSIEASMKYI